MLRASSNAPERRFSELRSQRFRRTDSLSIDTICDDDLMAVATASVPPE
jgi:hypothetical protein